MRSFGKAKIFYQNNKLNYVDEAALSLVIIWKKNTMPNYMIRDLKINFQMEFFDAPFRIIDNGTGSWKESHFAKNLWIKDDNDHFT